MNERRPLAVVTGASAGIGRAFALRLAHEGHDLLLVARRQKELAEVADEARRIGVTARVFALDLASPGAAAQVRAKAQEFGGCQLLINNAGVGLIGRLAANDLGRVRALLALNVVSMTEMTHWFLADMLAAKRGAIVNVASVAAFQPVPRFAVYSATKAYVLSLTEAVAREVAGTGVHVMALCPGATETEFSQVAGMKSGAWSQAHMTAEDVVEAAMDGLRSGTIVVVPGALNQAVSLGSKLLPRAATARLAEWVYGRMDPTEP